MAPASACAPSSSCSTASARSEPRRLVAPRPVRRFGDKLGGIGGHLRRPANIGRPPEEGGGRPTTCARPAVRRRRERGPALPSRLGPARCRVAQIRGEAPAPELRLHRVDGLAELAQGECEVASAAALPRRVSHERAAATSCAGSAAVPGAVRAVGRSTEGVACAPRAALRSSARGRTDRPSRACERTVSSARRSRRRGRRCRSPRGVGQVEREALGRSVEARDEPSHEPGRARPDTPSQKSSDVVRAGIEAERIDHRIDPRHDVHHVGRELERHLRVSPSSCLPPFPVGLRRQSRVDVFHAFPVELSRPMFGSVLGHADARSVVRHRSGEGGRASSASASSC